MPISIDFTNRLFPLLPSLAEKHETPFHIYDEKGILETGERLKRAMGNFPGFQEFYAVKALPEPAILRLMTSMGFGFDCSSIPEIMLAQAAGASGEQIMFTSNDTTHGEFEFALDAGCIINLDDISFLDKPIIKTRMPELICFRINPGKDSIGNSIIGEPAKAKYGITWEQIVPAYKKAREMGATRFGIHMMIVSNERDLGKHLQNITMIIKAAGILTSELGIEVEFINIGGGIGIPYRTDEKEFELEEFAARIEHMFGHFGDRHGFVPKLFMECGRYMTGPHGCLVNRAINCKRTYETFVGVQIAMAALMRPGIYSTAYHHITIVDHTGRIPTDRETEVVSVVGPICEDCDRLATNRELPQIICNEDGTGDFVVTHDTGAHGIAMCFNYNGRTQPPGFLLLVTPNEKGDWFQMTRRAQTHEDLLRVTEGL